LGKILVPRVALLTGARPGEVAGLTLAEIENLNEAGTARWIIPAKRSKNGRAHFIPLSELARQQMLSALKLINHNNEHLFPSPSSKGRLAEQSRVKIHDLPPLTGSTP
jgi:integrase